jgi:hypothetical protein
MSDSTTSPNLLPNNAKHASRVPSNQLPPSLLLTESDAVAISFIHVPTATVVADEFTVFSINVTERRVRMSVGAESELVPVDFDTQQPETWVVMKRYSSVRGFHKNLRKSFQHTRGKAPEGANPDEFKRPLPAFPPTKWFGNRSPQFVEQRRHGLSIYFSELLRWANVGQTADLRMRLLREYLTFSDPEIAAHRMFQGVQHGPKDIPRSIASPRVSRATAGESRKEAEVKR